MLVKGGLLLRQDQVRKHHLGKERLLVSDIKNSQLITQVTQELNKLVDDYIAEVTGVTPKKAKRILTLEEIAKPFLMKMEIFMVKPLEHGMREGQASQ